MLQLETQSGFVGFGSGNLQGHYYHSANMVPTDFGLSAYISNVEETSTLSISGMDYIKWLVEYGSDIYGVDNAGKVVKKSSSTWSQAHAAPDANGHGNGMVVDQTGRLLVVRDRYIQMYNGSWSDTWKDLGSTVTGDKGCDTYLDWVVIPHGNKVAVLNITDDSLNTSGFTFPSGCSCITAKTNKTGILLGVNMGNRSFVALWDAQASRAKSDWIWFDSPLKSICRAGDSEWIVTTTRRIVLTNGYTSRDLPTLPDTVLGTVLHSPTVGGTWADGNSFYLAHGEINGNYARRRSGVYILNLLKESWTFVRACTGEAYSITLGCVWQDSTGKVFTSHTNGTTAYISQITSGIPTSATFITAPFGKGGTKKVAEGVKVEVLSSPLEQTTSPATYTIAAKVYDFSRPLWGYATQSGTASGTDKLNVNGTSSGQNNAQVGDEVTILTGNNAGQIRHITAISGQNTSGETWTLDSALSNLTASGVIIGVSPFKLAKSFTVTSQVSLPLDGLYFDIQNRYKGRQFLVKIGITSLSSGALTIPSVSFLYDDLGII